MADSFTVERSATVLASPERIYPEIVDFHRWTAWSPWEDLDPDLHQTYSGSDSGTGAIYAWSGNRKAGEGRMEITEAVGASRIDIALDFLKPFKASNHNLRPGPGRGCDECHVDDDRSDDVHDQGDGHLQEHGQDDRPRF